MSPARFATFDKPLKSRVVHIRKKLKISIFPKMATTILIKFCGFMLHSKPSSMTLSPFLKKKCMKLKNYINWGRINNRKRKKSEKNKELCYNLEVRRIKLVWCLIFMFHDVVTLYTNYVPGKVNVCVCEGGGITYRVWNVQLNDRADFSFLL